MSKTVEIPDGFVEKVKVAPLIAWTFVGGLFDRSEPESSGPFDFEAEGWRFVGFSESGQKVYAPPYSRWRKWP